jgi:predicted 3-demethylubiquinone-9 3-methyltransferase (glyoxalase superfamily)
VNPATLGEMLGDHDPKKSKAVMDAMLKMTKIDIPTLERAYRGA